MMPAKQSSVLPLPATTTETTFEVQWSGQDEPGGSGLAGYDIYLSDTGRPYVLWLDDDTTETSAEFSVQQGHTYAFYSIATDNVGHTEAPPAEPDAQTAFPIGQVDFGDGHVEFAACSVLYAVKDLPLAFARSVASKKQLYFENSHKHVVRGCGPPLRCDSSRPCRPLLRR